MIKLKYIRHLHYMCQTKHNSSAAFCNLQMIEEHWWREGEKERCVCGDCKKLIWSRDSGQQIAAYRTRSPDRALLKLGPGIGFYESKAALKYNNTAPSIMLLTIYFTHLTVTFTLPF